MKSLRLASKLQKAGVPSPFWGGYAGRYERHKWLSHIGLSRRNRARARFVLKVTPETQSPGCMSSLQLSTYREVVQMNRKGFTLIELLIVVVIIGILAAIAIPKFANTKEKAYLASMKSDLRNLITAEEAY